MKNFIEVHSVDSDKKHLININHIVEVVGSTIYTDDFLPTATDFPHVNCKETYDEIKTLIYEAAREKRHGIQ